MSHSVEPRYARSSGLVDVLDRVLDKGLVIAGDISVSLAEVELLTIRIRLIVCSIDKAEQIGLDWWRGDRRLLPEASRVALPDAERLQAQIDTLQRKLSELEGERTAPRKQRRAKDS